VRGCRGHGHCPTGESRPCGSGPADTWAGATTQLLAPLECKCLSLRSPAGGRYRWRCSLRGCYGGTRLCSAKRRARRRVVAEKSSGMPVPSCPDLPLDGDNHAELDLVASGLGSASRRAPSLLSQEDLVTPMVCCCFFMVSGGLWALLRSPVVNPSRLFVVACLVAGAGRLYELDTNQRFV
jgi:hypothetical protein